MGMDSELKIVWGLHFSGPGGEHHAIKFQFDQGSIDFGVKAIYESGSLLLQEGAVVADWRVIYDAPIPGIDSGGVQIGLGRIDVEISELRGIGVGSLLMRILIERIKGLPSVPVAPITLAKDDASTLEAKARRNRFYERFGFKFNYKDCETWGESMPICSKDLVVPEFKVAKGWSVREDFK